MTSTHDDVFAPSASHEAAARNTKLRAANVRPSANFTAVGGRSSSLIHSQAKTGASRMIVAGLTLWNDSGEIVIPKITSSVFSWAYDASVLAACSKIIQKILAAMNRGMYA